MTQANAGDTNSRRFPRIIEREFAKLLSTLGFSAYANPLWALATRSEPEIGAEQPVLVSSIYELIVAQAHHDQTVLAPGTAALPFLRQHRRTLKNSWQADADTLFSSVSEHPALMIVTTRVNDSLPAQIEGILARTNLPETSQVLIFVTSERSSGSIPVAIDKARCCRFLFWLDHCEGASAKSARVFALFIHVVAAPVVVFTADELSLATISLYGRALVPYQTFYCFLDDRHVSDMSRQRETYFARSMAPYARILTGSESQAARCIALLGDENACLSPRHACDINDAKPLPHGRFSIANLLSGKAQYSAPDVRRPKATTGLKGIDVTVTIVFHHEQSLAIPALASLCDMVQQAKNTGLRVESLAMLDKADDHTRYLVQRLKDAISPFLTVTISGGQTG